MLPSICHCCGCAIKTRAKNNPNLCVSCEAGAWREPIGNVVSVHVVSAGQAPTELEHLLEIEGPTVLECFDAVEQANKAIREVRERDQTPAPAKEPGVTRASAA